MAMRVYERLAVIKAQQQRLHVSLLPNARSPFKQKVTAPTHRLKMLTLAITDTPLEISELELWQTPPVYSIDSVRTLRARYPQDVLIFIMGMDSARSLAAWREGLALTDYVHLWVFDRHDDTAAHDKARASTKTTDNTLSFIDLPSTDLSPTDLAALTAELPHALQLQVTSSLTDLVPAAVTSDQDKRLKTHAQGRIYIDTRRVPALSSTQIRQQIGQHAAPLSPYNLSKDFYHQLNPQVYHYIITHQLYSKA